MATMIEYELKEILAKEFGELKTEFKSEIRELKSEFNQRFDKIDQELKDINEKINNLTVEQAKVETAITFIKSDVSSLKTNQLAQIWVLIVAVVTAIVKFGFFPNP
jgi:predicted nuclease with TOPRIM domain